MSATTLLKLDGFNYDFMQREVATPSGPVEIVTLVVDEPQAGVHVEVSWTLADFAVFVQKAAAAQIKQARIVPHGLMNGKHP